MTRTNSAEIQVFGSVSQLEHLGWDGLLDGRDLYVSSTWLRLVERSFPEKPSYLLLIKAEIALGGVVAYMVDETVPPSSFYRPDRILARLATVGAEGMADGNDNPLPELQDLLLPSLMCGGRRTSHTGLNLSSTIQGEAREDAVAAIIESAEDKAVSSGVRSICFPYVDSDNIMLRRSLSRNGYMKFPSGTCSLLETSGEPYEEYLQRFSRSRRDQFRRDEVQTRKAGVRIDRVPLTAALAAELAPLEVQMHARYGSYKTESESRASMTALGELFGDAVIAVTARDEERYLGFVNFVKWRDQLHGRHAGFDYDHKGKIPLYFPVVFYEPVRLAHELRASVIDYSLGTAEAKRSRGCLGLEQVGYIKLLRANKGEILQQVIQDVHRLANKQ